MKIDYFIFYQQDTFIALLTLASLLKTVIHLRSIKNYVSFYLIILLSPKNSKNILGDKLETNPSKSFRKPPRAQVYFFSLIEDDHAIHQGMY